VVMMVVVVVVMVMVVVLVVLVVGETLSALPPPPPRLPGEADRWSSGCGVARSSSEALNTKVGREPPRGAAAPPHYACMEKQTNKNISKCSPGRPAPAPALAPALAPAPRAPSRRPAFSPFSTRRPLRSAPWPGSSRRHWSGLVLLKLFFFFTRRWSGVAGWGRAGGSSQPGIQGLKGRLRARGPGAPAPPLKEALRWPQPRVS
jgi:hypothetical protein